ncbi:GNAT family N-acetyltransferase [Sphingomonas sp. A2-49]|nr:GNAT family N-acetyltransferase [Sphingomonas sp. A2-49]
MHRDPEVMADLGGPFADAAIREKFDRYRDAWSIDGISRWAIVDRASGAFLGYAGVMFRADRGHPLGLHHEIGWRLRRDAWGRGLATAGARVALDHAWRTLTSMEIVAYTAIDNRRSQEVMRRVGLDRAAHRDFTARYPKGDWTGLVWVARRPGDTRR